MASQPAAPAAAASRPTSATPTRDDLAGLEELADRFGYRIYEGRADQIFTKPDSVKASYKRAKARAR